MLRREPAPVIRRWLFFLKYKDVEVLRIGVAGRYLKKVKMEKINPNPASLEADTTDNIITILTKLISNEQKDRNDIL
jgi:hypothetical protein